MVFGPWLSGALGPTHSNERTMARRGGPKRGRRKCAATMPIQTSKSRFKCDATRTRSANADLIVRGVAPRHWLDPVMSGSTLRAVLRRAKASVLVLAAMAGATN
jgi:hypothetical protein